MAKTVTVRCALPSGLKLRLFDPVEDGGGVSKMRIVAEPVTVRHGATTGIDAQFVAKWREQNPDKHDLFETEDEPEEN